MKASRVFAVLLITFSCNAQEFSAEEFAQVQEVNNRIMKNGMSYQVVKRCGADADTLKKLKAYLYKDIERYHRQYPKAKVNRDGVFELGIPMGDDMYERAAAKPKFCEGMLEEAKKYGSQAQTIW